MTESELKVRVRGADVGVLARADARSGDTCYRYLRDTDEAQAVSLVMPVRRHDYSWEQGLHSIFEMNLPEGILRHTLTTEFSKAIRGFDDFDLLSIVGPYQLGRVQACGRRCLPTDRGWNEHGSKGDGLLHRTPQRFRNDRRQDDGCVGKRYR